MRWRLVLVAYFTFWVCRCMFWIGERHEASTTTWQGALAAVFLMWIGISLGALAAIEWAKEER